MADASKQGMRAGTIGVIVGVLCVVLTVVYVAYSCWFRDEQPEHVTWVG